MLLSCTNSKTKNMNKFWLVLTITFLLSLGCHAQTKSQNLNWKEFVSKEGEFKVVFPSEPAKTVKEVDVPTGKLQSVRFEISTVEPVIYFGVLYGDHINAPEMSQESLRINYDQIREGFAKTPGLELLGEKNVWAGKNPGREFTIRSGKLTLKNRMFLIGHRQYQIITSASSTLIESEMVQKIINKFLDSFQLIEK